MKRIQFYTIFFLQLAILEKLSGTREFYFTLTLIMILGSLALSVFDKEGIDNKKSIKDTNKAP